MAMVERRQQPMGAASLPAAAGTSAWRSPELDSQAPLLFIINGASGRNAADAKRSAIEAALQAAGRTGDLRFVRPDELVHTTREVAAAALERHTAVVAVGGDGTINAVAQAAHAAGCVMGVLPQGTFNYFARTHHLATELPEAAQALMRSVPVPVQVGQINEQVFLVNASLGLYPKLLQDREAYKARFGRSRWVALASAFATLMVQHRQLRLNIQQDGATRDVRTPTLFIGNNRLQLEQVGLPEAPALDHGFLAAVMLRPISTLAMFGLLLRGAFGTLGEASTVESFEFSTLRVQSRQPLGGRLLRVAFDGEVTWMQGPLEFRVSPNPLYLLKPPTPAVVAQT